jgi:acetyl esterase/lipase
MPFKLDPEVGAGMMKLMGPNGPPPKLEVGDWKTRRENVANLFKTLLGPVPPNVQIKDYETNGTDGNKILLRWYEREQTPKGGPAVLYLHGGGYIAGSVPLVDAGVAGYVSATGVPFLSVEYRLAPETQYPGNVADAYAGLLWLYKHASELGVDPQRLAVMGESAGGGLAAALTHYNLEKNGPPLAKQILVYPMLDDRNVGQHPHIGEFAVWAQTDNQTGWKCLLGDRMGAPDLPPSAAPARMKTAEGLPPLYLDIGELDIFRDEDIEYAAKFGKVGIESELHLYPGCPHAFEGIAPQSAVGKAAFANRFRAILSIEKVGGSKL